MKDLRQHSAFTLLELMMVVGIIGLVVAMGVPAILSVMHEGPLRNAVSGVTAIFFDARAEAIHDNKMTVVAIYPTQNQIELIGGVNSSIAMTKLGVKAVTSIKLDQSVHIGPMLDINMMDFGGSGVAYIRFFPNGTCDETILELTSDSQDRKITLDPITSLASVGMVR
ncbi:MAG TPA: prepilin-type N-terminal cleavage/methylation domain-containing protein [Verrucomicrobiae bacterium]|jgi:prepilin-type N-terminal cleavage/methylation domain-containing protein